MNKVKIAALIALMGFVVSVGGMGGCSSSGGSSSGAPSGTDATAAQTAGFDVAGSALTVATGSVEALVLGNAHSPMAKLSRVVKGSKSDITVTSTSTCAEPTLPPITGTDISATISGTEFSTSGTGSCALTGDSAFEDPDYTFNFSIDCNNLVYSDGTYDLGIDGTIVESLSLTLGAGDSATASFDLLSNDLVVSVDDEAFDVVYNLGFDIDLASGDSSATVTVSGCLSLDGYAFNASGSITVE